MVGLRDQTQVSKRVQGRDAHRKMTVQERLRTLRDSLPQDGSVVLTRSALDEILADESSEDTQGGREPDYTAAEIAERFGRSPQTVRDWIKAGKLREYLFNGREYRVTKAALAEFEEKQRQGRDFKPEPRVGADLGAWRRVSGL